MASYYSHGDRRRREGGKGKGRLLLYQRDDEANMKKFQSLRLWFRPKEIDLEDGDEFYDRPAELFDVILLMAIHRED